MWWRKKKPQKDWIVGGLYLEQGEENDWKVFKVLLVDGHGVHIRFYQERFREKPQDINCATLTVDIGHSPFAFETVAKWQEEFLRQDRVDEQELDGYQEWKEAQGGYW